MKIKNKKRTCLLFLVLFIPGYSATLPALEPPPAYSLDQLLRLARQNNLRLKIAGLEQHIALEEYRDSRALPNPGLEYSRGKGQIPGVPENPTLWGIGARWSVPNPVYRYFFLKSLRTHITEAEIQAEMTARNVIKGLKTHYYRFQFYKKIAGFLEEKLRILEEVNAITRAEVSIGEAKEIDSLRSSVEIQKNKTALFRSQKTIAFEHTKLNEFLNYTLPDDFGVIEDFSFNPLPGVEEGIQRSIEMSPFIRLNFTRRERESANLQAAHASILEEIEVFGEQEKEFEGKKWKIGVGVSIPIFNWKSAHIRKAKVEKQKARLEYEHAKKHFFADVQQMVAEIRVVENEIQTFQGALLKEGRENMDISERLYKAGEIPLVVFLDSQNSFFEVQERYYEAITEWNLLKADLEELLGEEQWK